jgi:hypothetical protein
MVLKVLPVSPGFAEQILTILFTLCYNGSLVTWTVVSLTAAKFKLLIFSVSGFPLSYAANRVILMILYDLCLFPAQFCYIIAYLRKVESRVQIADRCAPWKMFQWCGESYFTGAANSQAEQAWVITDIISALCEVSLMLALRPWPLNREFNGKSNNDFENVWKETIVT